MSQGMMSVSALNTKIGSLLEATFMHTMVEGEVANVTYHRSGHVYFSIKDDSSTISCVMWRSTATKMKFKLEQGEHIVIEGSISVYVPRGNYQLIATHIEPYGKGTLAVAFEQLKTELKNKGYFDTERKKAFPKFPEKIAMVTAAGGAALQDMLKIAQKRWPSLEITVIDVLVQGDMAAEQIARGIAYADTLKMDAVVIGRGGGSLEDLWAFNERAVADAIYDAQTPVVSAVGHEVDMLISDFVADVRAPTPSAAMEMILPDRNEWLQSLDGLVQQMEQQVYQLIQHKGEGVANLSMLLQQHSPLRQLTQMDDRFAHLREEMSRTIRYRIEQYDQNIQPLHAHMDDRIGMVLRQKEALVDVLLQTIIQHNPTKRSKEGFAEVVQDGKRVALETIEVGDEFIVTNTTVKMRVQSLEKSEIRN